MKTESSPSSIGRRQRFLAALIVVTLTPFTARSQGRSSVAVPLPVPPLSAFAAHKAETLLR
ncbi:MAG: hypothetical protein ABIT38_17215, partial [Gemmatimonadaceae bacterium]